MEAPCGGEGQVGTRFKLFFILMISIVAVHFGDGEPVYQVDLDKRETLNLASEEDAIKYGVLPQYSHTVSYRRHRLLVEYLCRETGLDIKQIFPDTFDEHMRMVGQGELDISFSNPFIYIKLVHRYGARAFARALEVYGRESFRGQIICRADNEEIQSVSDCKGKRWIAVDLSSAGGYLYPLGYFMDHGLEKSDFAEIDFAPGPGGKQEKVVLAVYAGKYDIGSIREGTLNVVADKVDISEIRVIGNTPWYPGWVFTARKGLAPEVVSKIKDALCRLSHVRAAHKEILDAANIVGIIPAEDEDFDSVRELARKIRMNLDN
jgi:phosphonate transport system substrate-binding protein